MNIINSATKYIVLAGMSFVLVFGAVSIAPTQAHACIKALGFLDPLCVISGDADLPSLPGLPDLNGNDQSYPQTVNNTYTNSNNVNSNVNSPGAVVGAPVAYNTTPVYNYDYDYNYYNNNQGALQASCYPMPLNIDEGERATWQAQAYGGNGSYHFSWSGTDGLSGTGQAISKRYNNEGYKSATVTVRSGGQTVSRNCDGTLRVRDNGYNDHDYPYDYDYDYNYPLSVSCSADSSSVNTGRSVRWTAFVSGGTGSYNYSWNGTDGLSGSSRTASRTYNNPGIKYGSVTVWSGGQTVTQSCTNSVNVGGYYVTGYQYPVNNNNSGLDIACYSDPRTVSINQPATWITEVTGGVAPYTYTWSGTDDLSGNTSSVIKYYGTAGNKTAVISVRSADGRSETRACSTSITVRGAGTVTPAPTVDNGNDDESDSDLSAAALFSLKNVPWGWVAILIILVLFGTVVYLLFNRPKI